jgi:hypothetical protein
MKQLLSFFLAFLFLAFFDISCAKKQIVSVPPQPSPSSEQPPATSPPPSQPMHHDHAEHKEVKIPTPLAELKEEPLDIAPACLESSCDLILLYPNHLDVLDWKSGQMTEIKFAATFLTPVKSRAPSGKILPFPPGYVILSNCLAYPLFFSSNLQAPPGIFTDKPSWLPAAQPGFNWFTLQDGHFYDFERFSQNKMAAIDTSFHLNLAQEGNLATSQNKVGAKMCSSPTAIYTSSPTFPTEPDTILKFDPVSLQQISTRPVDGQILDLAFTDLNQDGEMELLVTVRNSHGIRIDVLEPF